MSFNVFSLDNYRQIMLKLFHKEFFGGNGNDYSTY